MIENFISYISDKTKKYVIFDIGSRDCLQSIEFYNNFPNAIIYAFECNPNTIDICRKNIENYKDRITLIEGAVCDYDGEITFYPINQKETITKWKDGNPGASSIFKSNGTYEAEKYIQYEIITNCHRLDTVIKNNNIPKVDIIWMDLQGAELLALKSLGNYLKDVKYIQTEISHKAIYEEQVMFNELNEFIILNSFRIINSLSNIGWQEDAIYEKILENEINDLTTYAYNKYSQRGHDGIIQKIIKEINIDNGFFVEFGAWDGIKLSNTRYLYEKGWEGCFIESDAKKYELLKDNYENTNIICLNKCIYPIKSEGSTIDDIYKLYINREIDILSIDIDGRDYEVFENMEITPKIIIIEGGFIWHPSIRTKIPYDIAANNIQQPLYVTIELAKRKGYQPILFNQDTFLLRNDLYYKYEYFQLIKNDHYNLWVSGFKNILSNEDRIWLQQNRINNNIIKQYEHEYYLNLKHSLDNIFDIVIPVGPKDKNIIKLQIEYTKKNIIGYRYIYIISYDETIQIDGCITISENIFPFSLETVSKYHGKLNRNGWFLQQLLKLYAGFYIPNILDKYLVIDADTIFLKPTTFFKNGKSLYNYGNEYHKSYFEHMVKLHPELKKIDKEKSGICHHMLFETKFIKELFDIIEKKHNDIFYNIFLKNAVETTGSGASEYEIYFNFILDKHINNIMIRELNWENVINKDLNNIINNNNNNNNFDYISYPWYANNY